LLEDELLEGRSEERSLNAVRWVFLANGRIDPRRVAAFNGEYGGARCSVSLVRMSTLKKFYTEMRTLLLKLCSDSVEVLAEIVLRAAL